MAKVKKVQKVSENNSKKLFDDAKVSKISKRFDFKRKKSFRVVPEKFKSKTTSGWQSSYDSVDRNVDVIEKENVADVLSLGKLQISEGKSDRTATGMETGFNNLFGLAASSPRFERTAKRFSFIRARKKHFHTFSSTSSIKLFVILINNEDTKV